MTDRAVPARSSGAAKAATQTRKGDARVRHGRAATQARSVAGEQRSKVGPVARELWIEDGGSYPLGLSPIAKRIFDDAHATLSLRHTGLDIGVYPRCCAEAMSEAIEAAEALGL